VLFSGKVIEERSLPHIRRFRDVLYRCLEETALAKKFQRGAIKPFPGFETAAFAAVRAGMYCRRSALAPGRGLGMGSHRDLQYDFKSVMSKSQSTRLGHAENVWGWIS
jgi:hypothetical protein